MRSTVDIGFLPNFKESDTLLLVSESEALDQIASIALSLSVPGASPIELHELPFVNAHGVSVHAKLGAVDVGIHREGTHFTWVRSTEGWRSVSELVRLLRSCTAAHQFLDGPEDEVTVMLSVGEYSNGIWQSAG